MSFLLQLEPEGQRTVDVESMACFFSRLATLHCVSPYQLGNALRDKTGIHGFGNSPKARCAGRNSLLANGFGNAATAIIGWVSSGLDNPNLSPLTFKIFEDVLPHSGGGILRQHRAWCPDCILEFRRDGRPDHEKLLWALVHTTRCPTHQRALEFQCPTCRSKPSWYSIKGGIMDCPHCDAPLVNNDVQTLIDPKPNRFERNILSVIQCAGENPGFQYEKSAVRDFVAAYECRVIRQGADVLYSLANKGINLEGFKSEDYRPSLPTLCNIADAADINLSLLMESPLDAAKILCLDPSLSRETTIVPRNFRMRNVKAAVLKAVIQQLELPVDQEPIALKTLCEDFGVSTSGVHYWFPEQSKALVEKKKRWKARYAAKRDSRARKIVDEEGLPLFVSGTMSNQKAIVKHLSEKHSVQKTALRNELKLAVTDWLSFRQHRLQG